MLSKVKSQNKGFTIIEVMIVLAIAGLIILVVLLAVPALQRNGRNTAMKSDAGQLLGYITDFSASNEGAKPDATTTVSSGQVSIAGASGTTATTGKIQSGTVVTDKVAAATPAEETITAGSIIIVFGAKCPDALSTSDKLTPVTSARSAAIIYPLETNGGSVVARCTGS